MRHDHSRRSPRERQSSSNDIFPPPFRSGSVYDSTTDTSRGRCVAVIGSMTQAMRARDALSTAAIHATVIKVSSSSSHNGCAYGVDFPCAQKQNVQTVLRRAGVSVRSYQ